MTGKAESLGSRRRAGKTARYQKVLLHLLEEERTGFEAYVRLHRLIHDCEPDTEEVPAEWPNKEDED